MKKQKEPGWQKVVELADCIFERWDKDREMPVCPVCGEFYEDCKCPGPHQEDIFEYKEIKGVLFARKKKDNPK